MAQFAPTNEQLEGYGFTSFNEGPPTHPTVKWKKETVDNSSVETEEELLPYLKVLRIPAP